MLEKAFAFGHDLNVQFFHMSPISGTFALLVSSWLTLGKFQAVQTLALSLLVRDLANVTTVDHPEAKYRHSCTTRFVCVFS